MPVSRRGHVPQWRGRHTSGRGAGPGVAVVGALSGPAFLIDWLLLRSVRTGHSLTPSPSAVGTAFLGAADAEQVSTCSLEGSREAACLQTALTFPESGRAAPAGVQLFPHWPCQEWAQGRLFAIHGGSHGCFFVFPLLGCASAGSVEGLRSEPEVRLPHGPAHGGGRGGERVPALPADALLLQLAAQRALRWVPPARRPPRTPAAGGCERGLGEAWARQPGPWAAGRAVGRAGAVTLSLRGLALRAAHRPASATA